MMIDVDRMLCYVCFFFFSSRRRHTRLVSDWSSDVCSSDLFWRQAFHGLAEDFHHALKRQPLVPVGQNRRQLILCAKFLCPQRVIGDLAQRYLWVMPAHISARIRAPL